jgi:hypothetical protein
VGAQGQSPIDVKLAYVIGLNKAPRSVVERLAESAANSVDFERYMIYDPSTDNYITLAEWFEDYYIVATATSEDGQEVYVIAGMDEPERHHVELNLYIFTPE